MLSKLKAFYSTHKVESGIAGVALFCLIVLLSAKFGH